MSIITGKKEKDMSNQECILELIGMEMNSQILVIMDRMAMMVEITGSEHLNCIEIGEVPKLIAILSRLLTTRRR
uniref:Uncharacterized protein n=1 Tax=viral metagenome TaxID=1070528 RepID=A0A6M3LS49_9ZZZZ